MVREHGTAGEALQGLSVTGLDSPGQMDLQSEQKSQ